MGQAIGVKAQATRVGQGVRIQGDDLPFAACLSPSGEAALREI
jgi:hypothetical protein